jgi:hypothetical protein
MECLYKEYKKIPIYFIYHTLAIIRNAIYDQIVESLTNRIIDPFFVNQEKSLMLLTKSNIVD